MALQAGEEVIREGQEGKRFYVVADGHLDVTRASVRVNTMQRGDGFGEISLLARVPCTATVTATTPVSLYALDAQTFIEVITQHQPSADAAEKLMRERIRGHQATG